MRRKPLLIIRFTASIAILLLLTPFQNPVLAQSGPLERSANGSVSQPTNQDTELPVILTWDYNILVLSPEDIARFVTMATERNISQINFRLCNKGVVNARVKHGTIYTERLDAFGKTYDPLQVLVEEGRKKGLRVGVHFDLFESSYDQFFIDNPQYTPQAKRDTIIYNAFPSYAHPEVREYLLKRVREVAAYGPDQIFFCTKSSHTPQNMADVPRNSYSVYNAPVVKRYKEKYGVDILKEEPEQEKVARIQGEFIVDFLAEAKKVLNEHGIESVAGATLTGYLQSSGKNIFLDWKEIVARKAADAMVMANSRKETFAWYEEDAPEKFVEILQEVKKNGIDFYAYTLSTVYWAVRDNYSWSRLLEYIPQHMNYFNQLGADALQIHEVYDEELWEVLGNWHNYTQDLPDESKIVIPYVDRLPDQFPGVVPHGGFEAKNSHWFWDVVSGWSSVEDWLTDRRSEIGINLEAFNKLWTAETGGNKHLKTEFDWKVMANSDYSGRAYAGRNAMLMYAEPNAGRQPHRTVSLNARSLIPVVPEDASKISVWMHGEELKGVEGVGMRIKIKDKNDRVIDQIEENQVVQGTFPWRRLEIPYKFPRGAHSIEVSLYLTVAPVAETGGRLWFDKFVIESKEPPVNTALPIRKGQDAFEGDAYARLKAKPGFEVISMPFNGDIKSGHTLKLAMRNNGGAMKVQVMLGKHQSVFKVNRKWEVFSLPLNADVGESVRLTIRPLNAGELDIDGIKIVENN